MVPRGAGSVGRDGVRARRRRGRDDPRRARRARVARLHGAVHAPGARPGRVPDLPPALARRRHGLSSSAPARGCVRPRRHARGRRAGVPALQRAGDGRARLRARGDDARHRGARAPRGLPPPARRTGGAMTSPDAVVIGSGPNGLVGANLLADQGWEVLVLEAQPDPGGAVRSGELTQPGYVHDRFSAFYPLAAASPVIRSLGLEEFGLRWRHAPVALANPTPDGGCAVLSTDLDEMAASLDNYAPGAGGAWRELYARWQRVGPHLVDALLAPFPPVLAGARLAAAVGPAEWARFARFLLLPVRTMVAETFAGAGGALLLGGNTLHTDLGPEQTLGGLFGWVLASLGQEHGFPVPEGGAGRLTDALVRRLEARGGRVVCSTAVPSVEVRGRRAVAGRTEHGDEIDAPRAVLADVGAPALYGSLVRREHLPGRVLDGMRRFAYDHATVKIDWALDGP